MSKKDKVKKSKKAPKGRKTTDVARPATKTAANSLAAEGDGSQATPGFKAGKDI